MQLVIVESPAKAKTIERYLGNGFKVMASYGHIRDLDPGEGSVDPQNNFAQKWSINSDANRRVKELTEAAKDADDIILATDPDREGEAISWHLYSVLREKRGMKSKHMRRVVFHEITKTAVLKAMENPRDIDEELVHAYLARRLLDYLVGYTLSPVLWRKLPGARSAGRVQSVALRLICEREKEIERFVPIHYWTVTADLGFTKDRQISAKLEMVDGKKLQPHDINSAQMADDFASALRVSSVNVISVDTKPGKRTPAPPFTTSTLQQEASRKLSFGARRTMQAAQKLYEAGFITYMRTDGTSLSQEAVGAIRDAIKSQFSTRHLPSKPRAYKSKAANAQEAHEAIRPTNINKKPSELSIDGDQRRLYDLIWMRTMACQMSDAEHLDTKITLQTTDQRFGLGTTGRVVTFGGFTDLYREGLDDQEDEKDRRLPKLEVGEEGKVLRAEDEAHATKPPARFSEASLVKKLEELGIGRPSTYASIISVLEERRYVRIEQRRFFAEDTGRVLSAFLEAFFERYVAYGFTAELEAKLDQITSGELNWLQVMHEFWQGFEKSVKDIAELRVRDVIDVLDKELEMHLFPVTEENPEPRKCPKCQAGQLGLRIARNGGFIGCSNYPECTFTRSLGQSTEGDEASELPRDLGYDDMQRLISLKTGRFGPYVERAGLDDEKAKRASLPKDITIAMVTLDLAIKLLNLPREVGYHEGEPIIAQIGRFGPYLTHANKTAKLASGMEALEIGMNLAVEKLAKVKPKPPAKLIGEHTSGKPIELKTGRFGPYLHMEKVMANIPKSMDPDQLTLAEAISLIDKKMEKTPTKTRKSGTSATKSRGRAKKSG